ncbi:uncharacterized protein [Watersipora subatra]|uniref:uncharacterized protein n=1 Tax=Watersipora subatra TaxID=2589382 RepID=UPI00355C22ED
MPVAQSSQESPKDSTQPSKQHIVALAKQPNQIGLLSMLLPVTILSGNGREMTVYSLLDNGSDTTYITENAVDQIKLKSYGEPEKVTICTLAGEETRYRKKYKFSIKGTGPAADSSSFSIVALEQKTIPHNENQIPTEKVPKSIPHLSHIAHLISPKLDLAVDMLIGRDNSHLLAPHESIIADASEPFAMRTVLGWTLCGGEPSADKLSLNCFATQNDEFHDINNQRNMSQNDMTFLKLLESGTKTTEDGSLSLPLPFTTTPYMPNNRSQALKRLKQLIKRLQDDATLKSEYCKFMQDMINSGHAEPVPDRSTLEGQKWYLPHFAVFHPKKQSLRAVFDASVRYGNRSLNEELLSRPDQMNSLPEKQRHTIRSILNSMTPKYSGQLTTEILHTAFMEITAAINNRPLSTISATDTEPVITINHLLSGKSQNTLPPPGEFTSDELYGRHMYRKTQQLAQEFCEMWNSQCLSKIETRSKWQHPQPNLKMGDVVLIIDENQPRNFWSTGKIVALHFRADSRVRKATVMLATPDLDAKGKPIDNRRVIDRPVQKLILLVSP